MVSVVVGGPEILREEKLRKFGGTKRKWAHVYVSAGAQLVFVGDLYTSTSRLLNLFFYVKTLKARSCLVSFFKNLIFFPHLF